LPPRDGIGRKAAVRRSTRARPRSPLMSPSWVSASWTGSAQGGCVAGRQS